MSQCFCSFFYKLLLLYFFIAILYLIYRSYVNTSEISVEIFCKNMISSQVKKSPLLWFQSKLPPLQQKIYKRKMVWYFIGVCIINRTVHGHLDIRKIVLKNMSFSYKFFNTQGGISYICMAKKCPLFQLKSIFKLGYW